MEPEKRGRAAQGSEETNPSGKESPSNPKQKVKSFEVVLHLTAVGQFPTRTSIALTRNDAGGTAPRWRTSSFDISKRLVYQAWKKVQANAGAPGVDAVGIAEFAAEEKNNLFKSGYAERVIMPSGWRPG